MKFAGLTLALAGIFAGSALGQAPTVTGLLNNYSYTLPGLPNYGIAQGSIFEIWGTNLSSQTTPLLNPPLQSKLNGVSISVTVNGTTTNPLFYFQSPTQMDAILPSATPVGTGTITVTTSAGTSAAFPIQVVASAFGLLTANSGSGPAVGFDADNGYAFLGPSAAANPKDILELWGTGLGPVPNDATDVAVSVPVAVYIGGVSATVDYAGRSGYAGLDQINVEVPSGVSGCYVSVAVVTGSYVSNFGTLPVAASGRTCSDTVTPFYASILNGIAQKGSYSVGFVEVSKSTTPGETIGGVTVGGGTKDTGSASFFKYTSINPAAYAAAYAFSSIGSCNLWSFTGSQTAPSPFKYTSLNAGPDVNINGPDGAIAMPLQTVEGFNLYTTPSSDTSFIPAAGGAFKFDNGSGGPDVGAFTAQLQMAPPLTWTNMNSISTVTRSAGVTVNWTGGDPSTYVTITGLSLGGSTSNLVAGLFTCQAATSAGTFTVSPAVLLSLPPSTTIEGISLSSLSVSNITTPVSFTATGLDAGWVDAIVENTITATYQ